MTEAFEGLTVRREIMIAAPPETVWRFLVDPALAPRWMGLTAALDARPGGEYRVEVLPGMVAAGSFLEVDPPRRLVHTWGWSRGGRADMPAGSTTVEVDLEATPEGTRLTLTHTGIRAAEGAAFHRRGWEHYLERLAGAAAGAEIGADPWIEAGVPWRREEESR